MIESARRYFEQNPALPSRHASTLRLLHDRDRFNREITFFTSFFVL